LANGNIKKRLIQTQNEQMLMAVIHVKQAEADVDTLIVSIALITAESEEELPVIFVGTDRDLLVMLVAQGTPSTAICMLCRRSPIKHCTTFMKFSMLSETQPNA